jgi:hypothetical protein
MFARPAAVAANGPRSANGRDKRLKPIPVLRLPYPITKTLKGKFDPPR